MGISPGHEQPCILHTGCHLSPTPRHGGDKYSYELDFTLRRQASAVKLRREAGVEYSSSEPSPSAFSASVTLYPLLICIWRILLQAGLTVLMRGQQLGFWGTGCGVQRCFRNPSNRCKQLWSGHDNTIQSPCPWRLIPINNNPVILDSWSTTLSMPSLYQLATPVLRFILFGLVNF